MAFPSSRSSSPHGIQTTAPTIPDRDENWALAVSGLQHALDRKKIAYKIIPGEAAFYGPKIDIKIVDVLGRLWQLSTVQFDFTLPARFELEYVGEDGERHQPVMVHRALFGSIERFFGVLIEHYGGAFPLWLAPIQVGLVPISERHHAYAAKVEAELKGAGLRVETDDRNEKMNGKIRDFANLKTPYILVFGDKEEAAGTVSVRTRAKGDQGSIPLADFIAKCKELARHPVDGTVEPNPELYRLNQLSLLRPGKPNACGYRLVAAIASSVDRHPQHRPVAIQHRL